MVNMYVENATKFDGRTVDYLVDGESTKITVNRVKELLPEIGNVTRIQHFRNEDTGDYRTFVLGTRGAIRIDGGLSSGYGGEGVRGLLTVIQECGDVDKGQVWNELTARGKGIQKLTFEF